MSRAEPSCNRPTSPAHRLGDPARRYDSAREAIEAKVRVEARVPSSEANREASSKTPARAGHRTKPSATKKVLNRQPAEPGLKQGSVLNGPDEKILQAIN